eukprot:gene11069-23133_t
MDSKSSTVRQVGQRNENKRRHSDGNQLGDHHRNNGRSNEGKFSGGHNKKTKPGELSTVRSRPPRLPANMMENKKKASLSPEILQAKQLLIAVSDYSVVDGHSDITPNLEPLAMALVEGGDLVTFSVGISDLFVQFFSELSLQIPIIATLLALIGKSDRSFVELVVEKLYKNLTRSVIEDDVSTAKLNLRALSCLASAGVVRKTGPDSVGSILTTLIRTVNGDWREARGWSLLSSRGRAAIFLVASTIPWVAFALSTEGTEGISLLEDSKAICSRVQKDYRSPYDVSCPHAVFHSNVSSSLGDAGQAMGPTDAACWDDIWASCNVAIGVIEDSLQGRPVTASCMYMPWLELKDAILGTEETMGGVEEEPQSVSFKSALGISIATDSSSLEEALRGLGAGASTVDRRNQSMDDLQSTISQSSVWMGLRFQLFDAESSPEAATLSALSPLEKHLFDDLYCDTLRLFEPVVIDDGTLIGSIELLCKHLLAVNKLLPAGVRAEYFVVEVLLLQLIQIPSRRPPLVVRVLLELCRIMPEIPPALATGCTLLFQLAPALDLAAVRELSRWHASHLLNSEMSWPYWDYLGTEFQEAPPGDGRRYYLTMMTDILCRATVPSKVKDALPVALHVCEPQDCSPRCPDFDFDGGKGQGGTSTSSGLARVAKELKSRIERKQTPDDVQDWLEAPHETVEESSQMEGWRLSLLLQAVLVISAKVKAISSLSAQLDRYGELLRSLAQSPENQMCLLRSCVSSLSHDYGTLWLLLDILLRRAILRPSVVASWACSADHFINLGSNIWIWTLIELPVLRSLDVCKASLKRRRDEANKVLTANGTSGNADDRLGVGAGGDGDGDGGQEPMQVIGGTGDTAEEDPEMDIADDDSRRVRDSTCVDDPSTVPETRAVEEIEEVIDTEAVVLAAAQECRDVYGIVMRELLQGLSSRYQELIAEGRMDDVELDSCLVAGLSAMRRSLRAFHGAQQALNILYGSQLDVAFQTYEEVSRSLDSSKLPTAAMESWNSFNALYTS